MNINRIPMSKNHEAKKMESIDFHIENNVAHACINRPKQLNALNKTVLTELKSAIEKATEEKCSVFVLSGIGDRAFVAGADIKEMSALNEAEASKFSELGQRITRDLEEASFITIGKIRGYALGGGCELAMACDILIASNDAKFGQPEVDLGLIAGFGGTQRLIKRVGLPVAMHVLCGGKILSADEAFKLGLISELTTPENLESAVSKTIKKILYSGPNAIQKTKKLIRAFHDHRLDEGLMEEKTIFSKCFSDNESKIGMEAFLNKKKPNFN